MGYSVMTNSESGAINMAEFEVSWKEYVDTRLKAMDRAIHLAKEVTDNRLELMNDIRAQLGTQAATFLTISKFDSEHKALIEKMEYCIAQINGKFESTNLRVQQVETMKATVNEKIKTWGLVLGGLIVFLEYIFRFVFIRP